MGADWRNHEKIVFVYLYTNSSIFARVAWISQKFTKKPDIGKCFHGVSRNITPLDF